MDNKIQVIFQEDKVQVDGRQLHMFLEVKTAYKDWFPRMCEYGFEEGKDFCSFLSKTQGRPQTNHLLTLDMAKELAMLQRTDKGKEARQYFLQVERDWNSPEKVMARALSIAQKTLSETKVKLADAAKTIEAQKPKVLFAWLRDNNYLMKHGSSKNMPTQKAMEQGLFEIKEGSYVNSDGVNVTTRTTKVTGKGQVFFVNRFLEA